MEMPIDNGLNSNLEFDALRQQMLKNPIPNTNYETAFFLLKNSELTTDLSEIEKEIKLSNLNKEEKHIVLMLLNSYQEQIFLEEMHLKKYEDMILSKSELTENDYMSLSQLRQEFENRKFDLANHLRRAFSIATVSRGYEGFERKSQNTVISSNTFNSNEHPMQEKKGFFGKVFGGGIR